MTGSKKLNDVINDTGEDTYIEALNKESGIVLMFECIEG